MTKMNNAEMKGLSKTKMLLLIQQVNNKLANH